MRSGRPCKHSALWKLLCLLVAILLVVLIKGSLVVCKEIEEIIDKVTTERQKILEQRRIMAGIYNLLCLAVIAIAFNNVIAVDYCNLKSCATLGTHTLCQYPSSKPAATCGQVSSVGLNEDDKQAIVKAHNELRRNVALGKEKRGAPGPQPKAANMPDLTWDNELATIAQRWANQCNFGHDKCRNVDRFAVGQNVGQKSSTGENNFPVKSFVQSWYDEVAQFDKNQVSKYEFDPKTGHYTQVVWAGTKTVGCGQISYKSKGWNTKYVVCNYGPSGNWIGQKIYEVKK